MNWLENTFGVRLGTLFRIKQYSNENVPNLPDSKQELEVYDDIGNGDASESLVIGQSNPRNSMLKKFGDEKNHNDYGKDDIEPAYGSLDIQPFPDFHDGFTSIQQAMEELLGGFGGGFNSSDMPGFFSFQPGSILIDQDDSQSFLKSNRDGKTNMKPFISSSTKYKSTSISRKVQPDGTIIEKKIYKDSSGDEEEVIKTYYP